jgi:hypothetical protein
MSLYVPPSSSHSATPAAETTGDNLYGGSTLRGGLVFVVMIALATHCTPGDVRYRPSPALWVRTLSVASAGLSLQLFQGRLTGITATGE